MLEIDIDFGDIGCIHTYVCMYTHQTQDITSILEDIQKSQKTVLEHRKTLYYEPWTKILILGGHNRHFYMILQVRYVASRKEIPQNTS